MARHLCPIAFSIVLATLLATVANASAAESQRLKVGSSLTVTVTESRPFNYRVTAKVVEILPNGVLVIGMRKSGVFNNYLSVYTLSGKINPRNVSANGSVLSEYVADLMITKQLIHLYDCIGPF
jgi:flagellar basal body L-ring protein FlgH